MNIDGHDIAVCNWSLRADTRDLAARVKELGLTHVQLATAPLLFLDDKRKHFELGHLRDSGLSFTAGMVGFPGEDYTTIATIRATGGFVPDQHWPVRRQLTIQAGKLCHELGVTRLTTHIGFVPSSNDSGYSVVLDRVREAARALLDLNVSLGFETGQEPAPELLQFMNDLNCRNVFVNFDPANMILYGGGDPIAAVLTLNRHIGHVHIKDAILSTQPGTIWGQEVPFGQGQVNPAEFLATLRAVGYTGPLAIEREAGDDRMEDVRTAIATLRAAVAGA